MGVDEGNLQVIHVDVILENCPITIPLRYILKCSDYGVYNSHCILHLLFVHILFYLGGGGWGDGGPDTCRCLGR